MIQRRISEFFAVTVLVTLAVMLSSPALAQGPAPDLPATSVEPTPAIAAPQLQTEVPHRFWDRENKLLFAGVAASHAADFAVTYTNLQSGGQELNPLVRMFGKSAAGLAANFAGETLSTVTMSYFFHKTRHYRMERAVSMVDISVSAGAVAYGLRHR